MQCAYFKDKQQWAVVNNYLPGSRGKNFANNNIKCCEKDGTCFMDNVACYTEQGNVHTNVLKEESPSGFPSYSPVNGGCVAPAKYNPATVTTCPNYTCADKSQQPICSSSACSDCVCGGPFVKYGDKFSLQVITNFSSANGKMVASDFTTTGRLTLQQSSGVLMDNVVVNDSSNSVENQLLNQTFTFESADYSKSDGDVVAYGDTVFLVTNNRKVGLTNTVNNVDVAGIKTKEDANSPTAPYKFVITRAFSIQNWTPNLALRQGDQFCLKVGTVAGMYNPYLSVVQLLDQETHKICLSANNGTYDPATNSGTTVTYFSAFGASGDVDYIPAGLICSSSSTCPKNYECQNNMCVSTAPPPPPPPPPPPAVRQCGVVNNQSFPDCPDDLVCVNNVCTEPVSAPAPAPSPPPATSWWTNPEYIALLSMAGFFVVILLIVILSKRGRNEPPPPYYYPQQYYPQ